MNRDFSDVAALNAVTRIQNATLAGDSDAISINDNVWQIRFFPAECGNEFFLIGETCCAFGTDFTFLKSDDFKSMTVLCARYFRSRIRCAPILNSVKAL
jgi:hypothetical protein